MNRFIAAIAAITLLTAAGAPARAADTPDAETLREGRQAAKVCSACHHYGRAKRKFGPHLVKIIGRPIASVRFPYSDALKALGGEWTEERLAEFLFDPNGYAPGTEMKFDGFKDMEKARAAAAYIAARTAGK